MDLPVTGQCMPMDFAWPAGIVPTARLYKQSSDLRKIEFNVPKFNPLEWWKQNGQKYL